jgi:predicted CopG family antitoxin
MTETITISDAIAKTIIRVRSMAETITTSDIITRFYLAIRNMSEVIVIIETIQLLADVVKFFTGSGAGGRRIMKNFNRGLRLQKRDLRLKRWWK